MDWELYFFYEDIRISEMLRVCKRVSLSIDKRSKEIHKKEVFNAKKNKDTFIRLYFERWKL